MYEQDYVMRTIKELIRAIIKLVFHMDTTSPVSELVTDVEAKNTLQHLKDMVDYGRINEAENQLYEMMDENKTQSLEVALLFYDYLNEKDNEFLNENGFSREEVKQGIKNTAVRYGLDDMAEVFFR